LVGEAEEHQGIEELANKYLVKGNAGNVGR